MPYRCDLGSGQQIFLDNQGSKTIVTVSTSSVGQQQQSSSSLQTGPWTEVPQVARLGNGVLIRCVSAQGVFTLQVQGTQIGQATGSINWNAAQTMAVHPVEHMPEPTMPSMQPMEPMPPMETMQPMRPMEPIQPMQPLQPMRMGNMEMSANPMEMRMGNMEMRMGNQAEPQAPKRRFCTQCGAAVDPDDRFCGSCGHRLE
jgi:hypothetical protein